MKKEYRNVIKTKKAIKEAFAYLVNEKKDIHKITVTELITKADIAKSTFYLHYEDIYNVAEEFEYELLTELKKIILNTQSTNSSIDKSLDLALQIIKENEAIYSKILNSSAPLYFIEKLKNILVQLVFEQISLPNLSHNANIKKTQIKFFAYGTVDLVVEYFKGNSDISLDEIKKIIVDFINK